MLARANTTSDYVCMACVFAGAAFIAWKTWQAGVRQSREFDRGQWRDAGRCGNCGYDLRGSPGRCPECGDDPAAADESDESGAGEPDLDPHALRDDWPAHPIAPRVPGPGETPVIVHATTNAMEIDLLVQQLQARGVMCAADERLRTVMGGVASYTVAEHCVACASGDESRAREIIERFRNPRRVVPP